MPAWSEQEKLLAQVENLLNIGIALSAERNLNKLLEMIVTEARRITNCDAGTLYFKQDNFLLFEIIQNQSLNIFQGGGAISLPPVPVKKETVSGYVALTGVSVNIVDVYSCDLFDFSGPHRYDKITGYHTQSMLVIPLKNHEGHIIGVLQLINALKSDGKTVQEFPVYFQKVVESLASQAAVAITNALLINDIENLLESFVEVMATAIDARTPYNANHTRRVALLAEAVAKAVNDFDRGRWAKESFSTERIKQLSMAAWLHDNGKIATPLSVMNKATRLEGRIELVLQRLAYIEQAIRATSLNKQIDLLKKGNTSARESESAKLKDELTEVKVFKDLIVKCDNPATFIDDNLEEQLLAMSKHTYLDSEGMEQSYLTNIELINLLVRKGTLTEEERVIMEQHVEITNRLLEKINFPQKLKEVPFFAASHHELLDGKGYPKGLKGDEIPLEARILALVDVFDALTACDRPYKKAMTPAEALRILGFMVKEGKIDAELFEIFEEGKVWEQIQEF